VVASRGGDKQHQGVSMDFQKAFSLGQSAWVAHKRDCPFSDERARYWKRGREFAMNVFLSKQGKFRVRFNEPRERGDPE